MQLVGDLALREHDARVGAADADRGETARLDGLEGVLDLVEAALGREDRDVPVVPGRGPTRHLCEDAVLWEGKAAARVQTAVGGLERGGGMPAEGGGSGAHTLVRPTTTPTSEARAQLRVPRQDSGRRMRHFHLWRYSAKEDRPPRRLVQRCLELIAFCTKILLVDLLKFLTEK